MIEMRPVFPIANQKSKIKNRPRLVRRIESCSMNRPFIRRVVLYALLYYVVLLALDAVIFLLSHIPPKAVNLDFLILKFGGVESLLLWPRSLLRRLWPGESTPTALNYLLSALNCLLWGLALAGLKTLWTQAKK